MDANVDASSTNVDELASQIVPRLQEASEHLTRLNERALDVIRARPGTCLLVAVGLGFVVGKLAARL